MNAAPLVAARWRAALLPALIAAAFLLLALTPTATLAAFFAQPARVQAIGETPTATTIGAANLRVAAAVGVIAWLGIPLLMRKCLRQVARPAMPEHPLAFDRAQLLCVALALTLGALLRALHARESLWYDEISSTVSFMQDGIGPILGNWFVPTNHVPQTVLSWASVQTLGQFSELSLRLPLIVIGTIGVWFAAKLGREVASPRAGVLTAFAMAICPIAVLEGAEARGYALVITLSTAALYYAARLRRFPTLEATMGIAICSALSAWAHPVSGFLAIGLALVAIVSLLRRRDLLSSQLTLLACILGGVTACVLLSPLSGDFLATRATYLQTTADQPTLASREGSAMLLAIGGDWGNETPIPVRTLFVLLVTIFVWRRVRFVLNASIIGVLLALLASTLTGTWIYARFLVFFVPATVLCVGVAADRALAYDRPSVRRGAFLGLLIPLGLVWIGQPFTLPQKQPIREAVELVAASPANPSRPHSIISIGLPDDAVGFYALIHAIPCRSSGVLGSNLRSMLASTPPEQWPTHFVVLYPNRISPSVREELRRHATHVQTLEGWADWGEGAVEVWRCKSSLDSISLSLGRVTQDARRFATRLGERAVEVCPLRV